MRYQAQTLEHIAELTNWQPQEAYFNSTDNWRGYIVKAAYLKEHIFPKHGTPDVQPYFALESSVHTRRMYAKHGIQARPVSDDEIWAELPLS
ncbi:MAG: hypothetical protein SNJ58_06440 [Aggregatilineales bacterium]